MDISLSFSDIRSKEVVNIADGKKLGRPCDLVFDAQARVLGIVTPAPRCSWFRKEEDIFIPWHSIVKIGDDIVLVNLTNANLNCNNSCPPTP